MAVLHQTGDDLSWCFLLKVKPVLQSVSDNLTKVQSEMSTKSNNPDQYYRHYAGCFFLLYVSALCLALSDFELLEARNCWAQE